MIDKIHGIPWPSPFDLKEPNELLLGSSQINYRKDGRYVPQTRKATEFNRKFDGQEIALSD